MWKKSKQRIYLDYASATPVDTRVQKAMEPFATEFFHNPGGIYRESVRAQEAIEQARKDISGILGVSTEEIYFTDGATEANNIVIMGIVRAWRTQFPEKKPCIITTTIEHPSVLEVFRTLENEGVHVLYMKVNEYGHVDIKELKKFLREGEPLLVSVGYANGEIGAVQDLRAVMKEIRHHRKQSQSPYPYVHSDAVQAVNYCTEISIPRLGIDAMTINAGKIYGPKKIASLFVRKNVPIHPLIFGGNQERNLRPGTQNTAAIVAMATSLTLTRAMAVSESQRLKKIQAYAVEQIKKSFSNVVINSDTGEGLPNIINISFPKLSHEEMVIRLDAQGIMCSQKSACKSGEEGDSHVILSLRNENTGSVRFSMGRETTREHINILIKELIDIIKLMEESRKKYYPQG